MKRMGTLAGVLATAVGMIVLAAPTAAAAAEPRDHHVPVGTDAEEIARVDGTVPATRAVCDDVPDIEWPPAGVEPPGHDEEALREFAEAMSEELDTAFPEAVPAAVDLSWVEWGGEWAGIIEDGQDYLTTWAVYSDEIGSTGTSFQIEAPGHFPVSPREFCQLNEAVEADTRELDDGSTVLHTVVEVEGDDQTYHIASTLHYRTDGTVVWVSAYDYDPIFDETPGPDRDEVALTTEQMTELATNPNLHL